MSIYLVHIPLFHPHSSTQWLLVGGMLIPVDEESSLAAIEVVGLFMVSTSSTGRFGHDRPVHFFNVTNNPQTYIGLGVIIFLYTHISFLRENLL